MPWRAGDLESDGDFANALGWQEGPDALQPDQGSWIHQSCAVDLPDGQRNVRLKLFVAELPGCSQKVLCAIECGLQKCFLHYYAPSTGKTIVQASLA